jgi:hypothetical protein
MTDVRRVWENSGRVVCSFPFCSINRWFALGSSLHCAFCIRFSPRKRMLFLINVTNAENLLSSRIVANTALRKATAVRRSELPLMRNVPRHDERQNLICPPAAHREKKM